MLSMKRPPRILERCCLVTRRMPPLAIHYPKPCRSLVFIQSFGPCLQRVPLTCGGAPVSGIHADIVRYF